MAFKKGNYVITEGEYKGRIGRIEANLPGEKFGNCMFYPKEGIHPYRICLKLSSIERTGIKNGIN